MDTFAYRFPFLDGFLFVQTHEKSETHNFVCGIVIERDRFLRNRYGLGHIIIIIDINYSRFVCWSTIIMCLAYLDDIVCSDSDTQMFVIMCFINSLRWLKITDKVTRLFSARKRRHLLVHVDFSTFIWLTRVESMCDDSKYIEKKPQNYYCYCVNEGKRIYNGETNNINEWIELRHRHIAHEKQYYMTKSHGLFHVNSNAGFYCSNVHTYETKL